MPRHTYDDVALFLGQDATLVKQQVRHGLASVRRHLRHAAEQPSAR